MILLGFLFSSIGLVLDICGFIGIFYLKPKPFNSLPPLNIGGMLTMGSYDDSGRINFLKESIDKAFYDFNKVNKENEKSANKFFVLVLIGFIFQLVGLGISFYPKLSIICS